MNQTSFQGIEYSELKEDILSAARHGEALLNSIRQVSSNNREEQLELYKTCPDRLGNVTAVERSVENVVVINHAKH